MARIRRVGKFATFMPPTFLEGVAQVADLWGSSSSVTSPRIVYFIKPSRGKDEFRHRNKAARTVSGCLASDVRNVGRDFFACLKKHHSQLPPSTAEKVSQVVEVCNRRQSRITIVQ